MISSVINPKGTGRDGDFARTNEFIFVVRIGTAKVGAKSDDSTVGSDIPWETMRRRNLASVRGRRGKGACGPNQFYPIFVDEKSGNIVGRGEPIAPEVDRNSVKSPKGCVAVFPIRADGTEMNWEYSDSAFDKWWKQGYIRANGAKNEPQQYIIQHVPNKVRNEIDAGIAEIVDRREDNSVIARYVEASTKTVTTQWDYTSHSAEHGGTNVLKAMMPSKRFPFPKSLYAVEDVLSFFVKENKHSVVLDFFAGSGTTAHAVMRLNRQDGGSRQCVSITNNEVAIEEQKALVEKKLRPGDPDWEKLGICDYVTKPRIEAAITGKTPEGKKIKGDYKFTDEFPMSEGFKENAEFFTLTYETPIAVSHNKAFARIAPLLWMRAGSQGKRIEKIPAKGWDVANTYGIITDLDNSSAFCDAIEKTDGVRIAYIVTDDDRRFQSIARQLPDSVEAVRLYESYLNNFRFSFGR